MTRANFDIHSLTPALGTKVRGVALSHRLDDETFHDIKQALLRHLVLFMPDQRIGPAEQFAFARRFGETEPPHPVFDD